jgi:hypothetical protein
MALASTQKRMMLISRAGSANTDRLTGVATMNSRDARLSALLVLQCPGQVQMPSC